MKCPVLGCYSVAFQTIVSKEIRRFSRIWMQTLLPPMITTSLYFLIFGTLIGSRVGEVEGQPFIDYILPGIILMGVISNSYGNVVSSFYGTKFQRNIEELLIAPVPNWVILAGYVCGGMARGLLVGLLVALIANIFTDVHVEHWFVTLMVFILTSLLFSIAGFINAIYAESFDDISIIPTFVLTPMIYLGGVFYSIEMLPAIWQNISLGNPILYMVNAFRYGMLGVSDINLFTSFAIIVGLITLLGGFSLYLLNKGVGIKA
jgi:ABC-2 type transport system permease protein